MQTAAITEWLKDEFTKRLQQKEGECLNTLVWFDPNRYWLPSMSRLVEAASALKGDFRSFVLVNHLKLLEL